MSLGLAFRAFFAVLSGKEVAGRVKSALETPAKAAGEALPAPQKSTPAATPAPTKPAESTPKRSEALTLLSALQREARLVDLIMEPLDGVDDAAIGAAVREVLRDSQKTLNRMFALQPLAEKEEGDSIPLPANPSPLMYRVVGNASSGATKGTVTHRGWKATKCEVPSWTGASAEAQVLAPIEVEA